MKHPTSLKAMAEQKIDGVQKTTQFQVDPRKIEIQEGFNARPIDQEHVDSFKKSIDAGAYIPALLVRVDQGRIIVVDGHHRVTAYLQKIEEGVDIQRVHCVQHNGSDAARIAVMIAAAQGKPFTPMQMGSQYKKLAGFGWDVSTIANSIGKSGQHVRDMIALAEVDSDVRGMVDRKEVAAHVALATVKKHGSGAGSVLAGHIETAKAAGKTKVTAKTVRVVEKQTGITNMTKEEVANLGASYVTSAMTNSQITHSHLLALRASPSIDADTKAAIKLVQKNIKQIPDRIDLATAIKMEMESGIAGMSETLCPEHSELIVYLRSSK